MIKSKTIFVVVFLLGVLFRYLMTIWVPQPFVFDQVEYHNFAVDILQKGLTASTNRLYGYPLFLALIYKIFGAGNLMAVYIIQSILDTATGFLVFLISKKFFKNKKVSWFVLFMYLFNPFTSSYAGVFLTETLVTFLLTLIAYLSFLTVEYTKKIYLFALLSLLLGYLPQIRGTFLFFDIAILLFLIIFLLRKSGFRKVYLGILATGLFILPFIYNIAGNLIYYKQFSIMTVDNIPVREFYVSLFMPYIPALRMHDRTLLPNEARILYSEYSSKPKNTLERKAMANKYLNLSIKIIETNPAKFMISFLKKTVTVWQRQSIYPYTVERNDKIIFIIYWINNLLLLFSIFGFIRYANSGHKLPFFSFWWVFLVLYTSIIHAFSGADGRYSLPAYPFIILFAGYGVGKLYESKF